MRQVETSPFFDFFQVARVARVLLFIIALSICWSLALMLVFAPGLSSNDSAQRAWMMTSVVEAGTTSTYTTPRLVFEHVFPPMMTLTGASLRSIGGGWSLHTFLQACWLFSSFGVLAVLIMGCLRGCLVWLSFCLIPIVWNHTMAMLPDAVVAAALLTITSALLWPTQPARRQLLLRCGIIFASGAFAFGYRFNTVTVLPLLVVAVFVMSPRFGKLGAASLVAALVLSAGIGPLLQRLVPYRESDVVAPMLAWEHVGTLRFTGDPDLRARHSLDAILGKDGETARAISAHSWESMVPTCFAPDASLPAGLLRQPDVGSRIRHSFIDLVRDKPVLYARNKLRVWRTVLGIGNPSGLYWIGTTPPAWIKDRGIDLSATGPLSAWREPINQWGERFSTQTRLAWLPWVWCSITLILAALSLVNRTRMPAHAQLIAQHALLLWLIGLCYFAGFLVIAGSYEWRYYFPSFAFHLLAACAWAFVLIATLRHCVVNR